MKNIKHIFFDLDHTLWDFERNSSLTFKLLLKKYKINIDIEDFLNIYMPINFSLVGFIQR
jgi:putative hydrolase of the HAD superfamily